MLTSMDIGGVEKSLLSLLHEIPEGKYDVTLLLLNKKGVFLKNVPNWIKIEEVPWYKEIKPIIMQSPQKTIHDYYTQKKYMKLLSFVSTYLISKYFNTRYFYYKQILKNVPINKIKYDVAIAFQGPTDIIDFYIANKVEAVKKISWVHFDVSMHFINEKLYKRLYKKYHKIFVVSKAAKEKLSKKIPGVQQKGEVFHNIISSQVIQEMAQEEVEFDSTFKGIKIVTVGRLSKEKGQDIAIKVLSRLIKDGNSVKWYCIGDGVNRKEYQDLIEELNVQNEFILLGQKENPFPYIANSDIYVQPSRHEGFCLTLAEARCLHKPIVTTNFTGAKEQITDDYNGFIVKASEQELYEKISYLINHPEKSMEFINNLKKENINTTVESKKLIDSFSLAGG